MNNQSAMLKRYMEEAVSWEVDALVQRSRSERRAWWVAGVASLIALVAVAAVLGLTPLKTIEPFVLRVDNNTGITDIVTTLKEGRTSFDETIAKYFIGQYVLHRESYYPETRNSQYRTVGLMSNQVVQQQYAQEMDAQRNPLSPLKLYGDTAHVDVVVNHISFIDKQVALVRYTKAVIRLGQKPNITHWAATLNEVFVNGPEREEDRRINPLGFQVLSYRNDAEVVAEGGP